MILFYSEFCQHCNILLETIKRHDKNKMVKTVSIDLLRSLKKPIDPKIHSVPALLLLNTKEYLFGKAVFDYLLLPNRGVLFTAQTTRDEKRTSRNSEIEGTIGTIGTAGATDIPNEPHAFALGAISAEQFAPIDDDNNDNVIADKNYNWDRIDNTAPGIIANVAPLQPELSDKKESKNKLPSVEEIMKQRAEFM